MAKTIRLYRVESPRGHGLYQRDRALGNSLNITEVLDTDLYLNGQLSKLDYKTRDGKRRTYHRTGGYLSGICMDLLSPSHKPEQLSFLEVPSPCGEMQQVDSDMGLMRMWARSDRIPHFDHFSFDQAQLKLDVTLPRKVISATVERGPTLNVATLLELQNYGTATGHFSGDPEGNRPQASEDGINTKGIFGSHLFAFRSLKGLSDWLDGLGPEAVIKAGACIRVLDVKKARIGECQAVFKESDIVKEFKIANTSLYELYRSVKE